MKERSLLKISLFTLCGIIVLILTFYFELYSYIETEKIVATLEQYRHLAPLLFMLSYFLLTILFIPPTPLTIASGALFGTVIGTIYTTIAATAGAIGSFFISRYFAKDFFQEWFVKKFPKIMQYDDEIEEHGNATTIFLRIVPVFPFTAVNFFLGITKVKTWDYIIGTFFGLIPGIFGYAYLGSSIKKLDTYHIIIALLFIVILAYFGKKYRRWYQQKNKIKS